MNVNKKYIAHKMNTHKENFIFIKIGNFLMRLTLALIFRVPRKYHQLELFHLNFQNNHFFNARYFVDYLFVYLSWKRCRYFPKYCTIVTPKKVPYLYKIGVIILNLSR